MAPRLCAARPHRRAPTILPFARPCSGALRELGRSEGVATLKVDPEASAGDPLGSALLAAPWRPASKVQPPRTRLLDLAPDEEVLLAQLSKKHRQYVHKADRDGVTVAQLSPSATPNETAVALADFYKIYADTAERAGFAARVQDYYERVWGLFAPAGHARLFFAVLGGERVATLFHFTCGDRAAEAYGGMTDAGADSRANYLLKWEAIRAFRAQGFASYDLWGIATGGIAHFKEGFGGRQVDYVGARDLRLRPVQDAALRVLLPAYGIAQRARLRLTGRISQGATTRRMGSGPRATELRRIRELRLLDDPSGPIECLPDPDLLAALEPAASHDGAVLAEKLPVAVHLAIELKAAIPHATVVVVGDVGRGL